MGWLNFGGKKRDRAQGFGDSSKTKSRKRPKSFILEKIVTPSAGFGDWEHEFDQLHQLLGSLSLSDLHLPNFFADGGVCPIDPDAPTNNLPPLIDFDPLGLYHDGIATQPTYNIGGAFETLPIALIPVDPQSPNPSNPNAIRQLLNFPLVSQPLVGSIDTGVSADSPYLNYANIKKGRDYVGGDDNPLLKPGEGSEHGTFMLGIIDAINKTAPKWVGRAIDSGRWADSLVEFVDAAKASGQKNAIANLSLDLTQKNADGSVTTRYELTPAERKALEYARQNGVMLVVAAGNDGGVMSVLGQASQEFDNIITVGAGDINGRSNYSSYGRGLDILADGGTNEHPALSTVGNDLGTMAGTSVATAKVAGAASLVWAANPALNYRQVMEILKSTARDLGPSGWDDETGFGFLNTLAAVDLAKKTKPEVYNPIDFGTPTTWGGEGKVTPMERAVNITNENFSAWVVSSNGITLRNSPNTSDRSNFVVKSGDTLTFDGWTYGEQLSDLTTGEADALWYRFRYNGGTYWVPSAWTGGYRGSRPPLLPPAQAPAQQYQQPPVSQQPTNNTVYLSTNAGEILQVDESTGASHKIYQGRAFTDLAVAPNGKLYGCTFYDGLYEINPSTGAERYVGPLAGGSLNSLTFSTDGRLYGADHRDGNLFQISPDNGQMNLIGNLGGPSSGDLVFNGANEILATVSSPNTSLNDRLVAINLATGNSRYIGDLGLLEVYGLSWENGQLTAYTSDRRKLAIDPNTAKATVVGTVSSNGLIWGAATKPATASSPTDDVRQKFLYAASLYPQVGAAITGMQDQGGGVFRQEFERAIMIWNGQQVTVYETKGRSASPTSPSSEPQVNNPPGFTPVVFTRSVGVDTNYGIRLRTDTNLNAPGESVTHDSQIEFDGWKYGEPVQDRTVANGQMDALWYRIKGTNYWIPSAFMIGYPPGNPAVLPGGSNGNTGGGNNNNTLPVQPADFTKALAFVRRWEGGYVNHPNDPGGATNKGITQNTYNSYRASKGLSTQDVRGITDQEVQDIYYTNYWIASGSNQLTSRLAMVNFDTAVNMGVGGASKLLQQARQSANGDEMSVVRRYLDLREAEYRAIVASNPSMGVFLNGWLNRLNSLRTEVGAMGGSSNNNNGNNNNTGGSLGSIGVVKSGVTPIDSPSQKDLTDWINKFLSSVESSWEASLPDENTWPEAFISETINAVEAAVRKTLDLTQERFEIAQFANDLGQKLSNKLPIIETVTKAINKALDELYNAVRPALKTIREGASDIATKLLYYAAELKNLGSADPFAGLKEALPVSIQFDDFLRNPSKNIDSLKSFVKKAPNLFKKLPYADFVSFVMFDLHNIKEALQNPEEKDVLEEIAGIAGSTLIGGFVGGLFGAGTLNPIVGVLAAMIAGVAGEILGKFIYNILKSILGSFAQSVSDLLNSGAKALDNYAKYAKEIIKGNNWGLEEYGAALYLALFGTIDVNAAEISQYEAGRAWRDTFGNEYDYLLSPESLAYLP